MNDPLLLTVVETAEALSLSRSTLYELLAAGTIESVQIGRARRIPRVALDDFVARLRGESGSTSLPRNAEQHSIP